MYDGVWSVNKIILSIFCSIYQNIVENLNFILVKHKNVC